MAAERDISVRVRLRGADTFKNDMQGVSSSIQGMNGWLDVTKGILASDAIKKSAEMFANAMKACVEQSIKFESAMAGVKKTTDMSDVELEQMGEAIKKLSTEIPLAADEIAGLVEAGGQLGIPKENLVEFAAVMANLGVATNLSAEEAATAFAKLANIMGTSADDYERMGSVVVELGNNMATTEADIVNMATKMASTAEVVGLTEQQVFALAATLSSLGIESEAGGSAISKLLKTIETETATGGEKLEKFASVAGTSAEEFTAAWEEDPVNALSLFLAGLGGIEESGGNAITTLEELGITEVRLSNAVLAMAGNSDLLTTALNLSNEAWESNTALANEAATRYETTESKITLFNNSVDNLATAIGDKLSPLVGNVLEIGTSAVQWLTDLITGEKKLNDMIDSVDAEYEETTKNIETAGAQAQSLIDRLEELEGKPAMNAAEQNEWNATLEKLTEIMPQTASLINLQTGAIEGGTAALRENTQAAIENAVEQAKQRAMQDKYKAYNAVVAEQAERMVELTLARNKASRATEEFNKLQEQMIAKEKEAIAEAEKLNAMDGGLRLGGDLLAMDDEYQKLQNEVASAGQAVYDAEQNVKKLEETVGDAQSEIDAAAEEMNAYAEALDIANESALGLARAQQEETEASKEQMDQIDQLQGKWEELTKNFEDAYAKSKETVDGIAKGFGKIEMPKTITSKDTLSNLQSQIDYMDKYRENLKKVQEMGLDNNIVEQLSDGSRESAAVLQGIINDGGKSVDELNAKFAEVSASKDSLAQEMAAAITDFSGKAAEIEGIADSMATNIDNYDQAYASGANTVQGAIDGINSKIGQLRAAAAEVAILSSKGGSGFSGGGGGHYSHAAGIGFVPYDEYPALLHRGEMVLTALEARAYRAEQFANYGMVDALERGGNTVNRVDNSRSVRNSTTNNYRFGDVLIKDARSGRELAESIAQHNRRQARGRGQS